MHIIWPLIWYFQDMIKTFDSSLSQLHTVNRTLDFQSIIGIGSPNQPAIDYITIISPSLLCSSLILTHLWNKSSGRESGLCIMHSSSLVYNCCWQLQLILLCGKKLGQSLFHHINKMKTMYFRVPRQTISPIGLDKSGYHVNSFLISPRKHIMLWVLIRSGMRTLSIPYST